MDIPDALTRFVPSFDILFLSVKEAAASQLTRTDHPFGWLLTVLQKEHADKDAISNALQQAMSHLSTLGTEQAQQLRRAVGYFLLLILHRRPIEEHAGLITILDQHTHNMEVDTMAEALTGTLLEQGIEQGIEQGEIRGKRAAVLRALQIRFGPLSENITAQINAIQTLAQLDTVFDKIFEAETIDDIF